MLSKMKTADGIRGFFSEIKSIQKKADLQVLFRIQLQFNHSFKQLITICFRKINKDKLFCIKLCDVPQFTRI